MAKHPLMEAAEMFMDAVKHAQKAQQKPETSKATKNPSVVPTADYDAMVKRYRSVNKALLSRNEHLVRERDQLKTSLDAAKRASDNGSDSPEFVIPDESKLGSSRPITSDRSAIRSLQHYISMAEEQQAADVERLAEQSREIRGLKEQNAYANDQLSKVRELLSEGKFEPGTGKKFYVKDVLYEKLGGPLMVRIIVNGTFDERVVLAHEFAGWNEAE